MRDADEPQPESKQHRPVVLALISGALAGVFLALCDFGAMWLWLPLWRDRGGLLLRLLATLVPVSALLSVGLVCLVGLLARATRARVPTRFHAWVLPIAVVAIASFPLHVFSLRLMSGGAMSRLPWRDAVVVGLSLALPMLAGVAAAALAALSRWSAVTERRLLGTACVALGSAFAMGKVNQSVLPNLYEYMHQALAVATWLSAALGMRALIEKRRAEPVRAPFAGRRAILLLTASICAALAVNTWTLNLNLNVRVALFDARCALSRALLSAAHPVLHWVDNSQRPAYSGLGLARGQLDTTGLPTQPGAHVLLITIDALRADHLGSYGYGRGVSPELDRIASRATQFDRAYAQAPHSSYSLSSVMTSEYVHEVVDLTRPLPTATLATTLRDSGYHTAAFFTDGIFHTEGKKLALYRDSAFGFALFDHANREAEDQTVRVLQEADRIRDTGEPPSLLWVHYFDVHEPYQKTTFGTGEMDRYDSEIHHVDGEIRKLIAGLTARFKRDLVIAITADHGEEFREHGGVYHGSTLYDEQVRVPLIVSARSLPQRRVSAPVELLDLAPTLLGLVGIEPAPSMRGRDLRVLAVGRDVEPRPVFSAVLTKRMALRWPYKLSADLRFGLFELYDLSLDPHERKNLANLQPARLNEMTGLVYAWLDSLEHEHGVERPSANEMSRELRWGRLGDRRAVQPMSRLLLDRKASRAVRIEAAQILAKLADTSSAPALVAALSTHPPEVAAEAAVALGRMYDVRAQPALRRLVHVEDPYLRARAAVSLARLRDREAVPALIDALWVAPTQYEREEAVRWLGRLRDPRAVEPLLGVLPEFGLRYLVPVALGMIGDHRAFAALSDMIAWEHHTNIRDEVARGLGLLGDARAVPLLVDVLRKEPELKNTPEALVRLGAIEKGYLGGVDASGGVKDTAGFERCEQGPLLHDWDYLERTWCLSRGARLSLRLPLPGKHGQWRAGAEAVVRLRRADSADPVEVQVVRRGAVLATLHVDGGWAEHRVKLDPVTLTRPLVIELAAQVDDARLAVDHVLLVPRWTAVAP